MQILLVFDL